MELELLHRFFSGRASCDEEHKVEEWVHESEANRAEYLDARRLFDALLLSEDPQKGEWHVAKAEIHNMRSFFIKVAKIASVVLFLIVCLWFVRFTVYDRTMQTIEVPIGHRANITLPDGTNVWLNGNSTISYPNTFGLRTRTVTINGEAFFDVMPSRKPFIAESSKGSIEVLSTQFNVFDHNASDEYEVALIEGSIKVSIVGDPTGSVIMSPGYLVSLEDGKLNRPVRITDYDAFRWKDGLICFKDASFSSIMRRFEKSYGIRIVIDDFESEDILYTGKFRQEDGVNYALRVLQGSIGFEFERDNENHIITIRKN